MGNDVLRLELPTATLRVPVMLVLCAMASNQAAVSDVVTLSLGRPGEHLVEIC